MAGIQPSAHHPGGSAIVLVSGRCIPYLTPGSLGGARPQHLQPDVHHGRPFVALASQALHACGHRVRSRHRRRAHPVPVLRHDLRDDRRDRHRRIAANLFTSISTHNTYPPARRELLGGARSLHSLGRQQVGDRSALRPPGRDLHQVHLGWVVQIYNASEALPNLVNPFWMLPLLGILKLKARDIVGYGVLQLIVHIPVVFFLCWLFARYIPYLPPMK